jgi:hypothetical protein
MNNTTKHHESPKDGCESFYKFKPILIFSVDYESMFGMKV